MGRTCSGVPQLRLSPVSYRSMQRAAAKEVPLASQAKNHMIRGIFSIESRGSSLSLHSIDHILEGWYCFTSASTIFSVVTSNHCLVCELFYTRLK